MKLASGFAALLIATSVIGGGFIISRCGSQSGSSNQVQVLEPLKPLKVEQIDKIASEITVLIDSTSSGSGVLIAKERGWFDTTYYVLTAKHVIQGKNEFDIVTPDGERYRRSQNDVVEYLPDADLAVVQFASNKQYALARLTSWDFQNSSIHFEGKGKDMPWAFVSGFPDPKQEAEFPKQKRLLTTGFFINATDSPFNSSDISISNGYELTYTASTYRGMSGSPILDTSGRLIGIHGRNTGEQVEGTRRIVLGYSIGVPISRLLKTTSTKLQKITTSSSIDKNSPLKTVDKPLDYLVKILQQDYKAFGKSCRDDRCLNYINRLLRVRADEKEAFRLIEAYLSIRENSKFYPAWYLRGLILNGLENYEEALSSLDKAVQLNPDFYEAKVEQCSILSNQLKNYEKAIKACDQGIEIIKRLEQNGGLQVKPFNVWHQKANALDQIGQIKEAIATYSIAVSILPNPHSYLNRGTIRANKLEDYQGAIEDFTQAIQLNSNYTQGYINRSWARFTIGDKKGASEDLDIAANINIEYTNDSIFKIIESKSNDLGVFFEKKSDFKVFYNKKAIEIYRRLINQNTNSSNLSNWYEKICQLQATKFATELEIDIKNAINDCSTSIKLNPSSLDSYQRRALLYKKSGDSKKSIEDYNQLINLLPKSDLPSDTKKILFMNSYGGKCELYYNSKQYESALKECQMAIDSYPTSPIRKEKDGYFIPQSPIVSKEKSRIYYLQSGIYNALKNYKMAIQSISSAIDLDIWNGWLYLDRSGYRYQSQELVINKDTKKIIAIDKQDFLLIVDDFRKSAELFQNNKEGQKALKNNVKATMELLSYMETQDEEVISILSKLKNIDSSL